MGLAIGIPFSGWAICIDEEHLVLLGHFAHTLDVKNEVCVLQGAIGHTTHRLDGGRRDQGDPRRSFPIVFLGGGVLEKGIDLFLESPKSPWAFEGGIEPEERKRHVGLQPSEPLVGRLEVPPRAGIGLQFRAD